MNQKQARRIMQAVTGSWLWLGELPDSPLFNGLNEADMARLVKAQEDLARELLARAGFSDAVGSTDQILVNVLGQP